MHQTSGCCRANRWASPTERFLVGAEEVEQVRHDDGLPIRVGERRMSCMQQQGSTEVDGHVQDRKQHMQIMCE